MSDINTESRIKYDNLIGQAMDFRAVKPEISMAYTALAREFREYCLSVGLWTT